MKTESLPIKREVVHVPMRDGVRLSVHVHRPDAAGPFPVIVSYTPYRKGPLDSHHPIVEHGYATVNFDIRGTGNSEGHNDSIYSPQERQDGYEMIEWAASQPWSSGKVGMWGISFGAVVSLQMAMAAHPALKAIIARSGSDDPYTEWANPGGSPRPYMYLNYAPIMTAANFAPPDPEEVGERWSDIWSERLSQNVPWGIAFAQHLLDGPFWRERSLRGHYDRVKCPVFVVGGWADWYPSALLRIYANLSCPKRALIGPWSHQMPDAGFPGPRIDWLPEAVKWFDTWLKGVENGLRNEPPVTLFIREHRPLRSVVAEDAGTFRCEQEWPIARTQPTPMYLCAKGRIAPGPSSGGDANERDGLQFDPRAGASTGFYGGGPFNVNCVMPLDQRADEHLSLSYTSLPLQEDTEVTGSPRLVLFISTGGGTALLAAKLGDVAPDGTTTLVTTGCLNLSHRDSHSHPTELETGKIYRLELELMACAYKFAKGHRIRISLAHADLLNAWATPVTGISSIHRDAAHPSCIVLPIVPPREPSLAPPDFRQLPAPSPDILNLETTEYTICHDPIREAVQVQYRVFYGANWENRATLSVSALDPAQAEACGSSQLRVSCQGRRIVVDAKCVTSSDAKAFHHTVQVVITMNDAPYFSRHWATSVPLGCF